MAYNLVSTSSSYIMSKILQWGAKLKETKENIRKAINNRGIEVSDDILFSEYPNKVSQIMFDTDKVVTIGPTKSSNYQFSARCTSIEINEEKPFKKILVYGDTTLGDYDAATKRVSGSDIGTWSVKGQAKRCAYNQTYMTTDIQEIAMSAYDTFKSYMTDVKHLIVTYSDGTYKFAFLPVDFKIVDVATKTQYKPPQTMYGTSYFRIQKAHVVTVPANPDTGTKKNYRYFDTSGGSFDQVANIVYSSVPLMCGHVQIWPNNPNVTQYEYGGCSIL